MLKTKTLSASTRSYCIKCNKNEVYIEDDGDISSDKIENKIANLLNSTKKMRSRGDFLTSKARLAFI